MTGIKEVHHCRIDASYKSLGVVLAPDDNNTIQIKRMCQIEVKFGDGVRVGFIKGHDVFHGLNSIVIRSLNWPLPVIALSKKECIYIMAPIIKQVLAKLKVVSTIKRKFIYRPIDLYTCRVWVSKTCIRFWELHIAPY